MRYSDLAIHRCGTRLVVCLLSGLIALASASAQAAGDPYWASSGTWGQPYRDQWALVRIGWAPELANQAKTLVTVAVIDTGLDYYHRDLPATAVFHNRKEVLNGLDDDGNGYVDDLIGWNFVDGNGNPWDHSGHGTHVAGVIAAGIGNDEGIAGMNAKARILPLKALNFIGQGRGSRVAEAIYYAVGQGARVINLSLGGDEMSETARRAIGYADAKGVVIVVAAGNEGRDIAGKGPAALPNVITVGASGPDDKRAPFANHGAEIDLVAPGVDILSLRARRTDVTLTAGVEGYRPGANFVGPKARYYRVSGTSFAAPFVTGVASLILSHDPGLDARAVKRMIIQSARDIDAPGVDLATGYGLLDAKAALSADPAFFIEPAIHGVALVRKEDGVYVRMSGTADANQWRAAWIEIGQGENPKDWRRAGRELNAPVRNGVLDDLPAGLFRAGGVWSLRLVVEHENGRRREARHVLRLN